MGNVMNFKMAKCRIQGGKGLIKSNGKIKKKIELLPDLISIIGKDNGAVTLGTLQQDDITELRTTYLWDKDDDFIDIREYYVNGKYRGPTRKGIRIHFKQFRELLKHMSMSRAVMKHVEENLY